MNRNVIIDDTSVYEIDPECMERKRCRRESRPDLTGRPPEEPPRGSGRLPGEPPKGPGRDGGNRNKNGRLPGKFGFPKYK